MQVFGISPDVDAVSRRRRIEKKDGQTTRSEVSRRAAHYGDIVDLVCKRHFRSENKLKVVGTDGGPCMPPRGAAKAEAVNIDPNHQKRNLPKSLPQRGRIAKQPNKGKAASGVLPFQAESYDAPSKSRRSFFDGAVHADQYAELLGRPQILNGGAGGKRGSAFAEVDEGDLPWSIRRALEAALPGATDPNFPPEVNNRIRAQVEAMVLQRWSGRKPRKGARPQVSKPKPGPVSLESTCSTYDGTSVVFSTEETLSSMDISRDDISCASTAPTAHILEEARKMCLPTLLSAKHLEVKPKLSGAFECEEEAAQSPVS